MTHIRQSGRREGDQTAGVQQEEAKQPQHLQYVVCFAAASAWDRLHRPPDQTCCRFNSPKFSSCPTWWLFGSTGPERLIPPLSAAERGGGALNTRDLLFPLHLKACRSNVTCTVLPRTSKLASHFTPMCVGSSQGKHCRLLGRWRDTQTQASFSVNTHQIRANSFSEQAEF